MSDPGRLAPAPVPLASPRPGLLQRFLLQPHFPAVLRVTAGPELGRVGEWERREGASTHLSGSGRPYRGHPLQLAGGLCRSLRAWSGGAVVTVGQKEALGPLPVRVLPSARQPDPPTHMPTELQGPRSSGGWSVPPYPQVSCPVEGICLQLWPCLLRSWGPGSQWSSALEELSPCGEPRESRGP